MNNLKPWDALILLVNGFSLFHIHIMLIWTETMCILHISIVNTAKWKKRKILHTDLNKAILLSFLDYFHFFSFLEYLFHIFSALKKVSWDFTKYSTDPLSRISYPNDFLHLKLKDQ